jgi:DMSO reductase anchor subunit
MKQNNQNTNAFLIHISAFAGFIFPFGHIITPLIAWQTLKEKSPFLNEQGKEAVNFNLSYTLYAFILTLTFIPFALGTFFRNVHNFDNFQTNFDFNTNNILGFTGNYSILKSKRWRELQIPFYHKIYKINTNT